MALVSILLAALALFACILIVLLIVLANLPVRPLYTGRARADLKKIKRQIEAPEE